MICISPEGYTELINKPGTKKMKISILGTGIYGKTMAERFISDGDEVMIGTRNVEETLTKNNPDARGSRPFKEWYKNNSKIKIGTFADTAKFGEIIILATFGNATKNAIDLAGKENFEGKIIIDTTNPLDISKGGLPEFTATPGNSLGEQIQRQIPKAKVVKAFNQMGVAIVVNPKREEGDPVMFIAGNDESAKKKVSMIATKWGWKDIVDYGDISESFWLESLAMIWIYYAFKNNSLCHAFKLLKK